MKLEEVVADRACYATAKAAVIELTKLMEAALYLVSPQAGFDTGLAFAIDGGFSI